MLEVRVSSTYPPVKMLDLHQKREEEREKRVLGAPFCLKQQVLL